MRLAVFGLVSIDILQFRDNTSFVGGGALATAWVASLWETTTFLYSVRCTSEYRILISNNSSYNERYFRHMPIHSSGPMTKFWVSRHNNDYQYSIENLNDVSRELFQFLQLRTDGLHQYIKIPASNIMTCLDSLTNCSINLQGDFSLQVITQIFHTNGFIFLNEKELMKSTGLPLIDSLQYVNDAFQSTVITLGAKGVVCYYEATNNWYYCPAILADVVETLGCGDAFAGGFLSSYLQAKDILTCLSTGILSSYLATLSPSNMVTKWIPRAELSMHLNGIVLSARRFETLEMLISYAQGIKWEKHIISDEKDFPVLFDWCLKSRK